MADVEPQPPSEGSEPSPAESARRPSRGAAQAVGPALDHRGEALFQSLPGPLAPFEPEVATALDEVVVTLEPRHLLAASETLRQDPGLAFDYLRCLSVVDYDDSLQVVYHLWSREHRHKLVLKTGVAMDDPRAPSVIGVWPAADWFEREGHDLYGVVFEGHPNPKPLLLYEGFEGFPARRSFPFHEYEEW